MARARPPIWLAAPSRWAALSRPQARIALALLGLALLVLVIAALPVSAAPVANGAAGHADIDLYRAIAADVRHGTPYYNAAAAELRAGDYPLRPFVTFRLPTLALLLAWLPRLAIATLLIALAGATMLAWYLRLREGLTGWRPQLVAMMLLAGGLIAFVQPDLAPFHEIWAGLLIALALALRRPDRWIDAAALTLTAMLLRETAALFALVMAGAALAERRPREALGWGIAIGLFALVLALHAQAVAGVVRADDPMSPGWTGWLGPGFVVRALGASSVLRLVPAWLAALLLGLSLAGWASWRHPTAVRALATLLGYALLLAVAGRADTFYWGLLIAPIALLGLVFAPDGLRDLIAAALDRRRVIVRKRVA